MARTIDADALKKQWSMADKCEDCPQDARRCQFEQDFTRMDICEMIDEAPTVGGWISVKDRLPDEKLNPYTHDYQEVICLLNTRFGYDVRVYKFGRGHFLHDGLEIDKFITHWMPLPTPPGGES